jgi:hypothetical protein
VLVVAGDAVRGQMGLVEQYGVGALLVGGVVATVIAVSVSDDAS